MLTIKSLLLPPIYLRSPLKNLAHNFFFLPAIILLAVLAFAFAFQRSGTLNLPLFDDKPAPGFVLGFYPLENNGAQAFRWTASQAIIDLPETLLPAKINLDVI